MERSSLRARCLAAMGLYALGASGCETRERWPTPERQRAKPTAAAPPVEGECREGLFCRPAVQAPKTAAPPPYGSCAATLPLPEDEASELPPELRKTARVVFKAEETRAARDNGDADACCYVWFEHCRGRPIIVDGAPLLAEGGPDRAKAWCDHVDAPPVDTDLRHVLAAHWATDARYEHASVAAFTRLALELMAHGAPADLVDGALAAARDEVRHARLTYGLARAYGAAEAPGRLPTPARPRPSLAALAAETWRDGCLTETVAAWLAHEAARGVDPSHQSLREALTELAEDEMRHAALAWRICAWAIVRAPVAVRRAIRAAVDDHDDAPPPPPDDDPQDTWRRDRLLAVGVLSPATRRRAAQDALADVVVPCTEALLALT